MTIGTYVITNTLNNRMYFGSSKNIEKRCIRHLSDLKCHRHCNRYLQSAYDKYGVLSFSVTIHQTCCSILEAREAEQVFLDEHFGPKLYNLSKFATGGDLLSYHPQKMMIYEQILKSQTSRLALLSHEDKKLKFGKPGAKNGMFGKTHTPEARLKISIKNKGRTYQPKPPITPQTRKKMSDIAKQRTGKSNPFFGKHHSEETKQIMSEKKKAKKTLPPNTRKVNINNIIYESVTAAARALQVCPATIVYRLKKYEKYKEYKYID